jgi:DNA polymerase III subunit delta'
MAEYQTRGHPGALAAVARAVRDERPPHALLLVGPARVGKTTLAFDLAAGLLCLAPQPADRPCGECAACRKVAHGNHPDVHRLAPEGAGGQIRLAAVQALTGALALLPLEGRYRVAIVEQAQRLNHDAQNALLKTLEEPPARVCLILAADESANLLPTLVSRCVRLRLSRVPPDALAELLDERADVDSVRAAVLARLSDGRPGAALALARQPEVVLARSRLTRQLLDLLAAERRARLAAVPALLDDAAAIVAASDGAAPSERIEGGAPDGSPRSRRQAARRSAPGRTPAERRAAAAQLLAIWRDLARDLALVAHGGRSEVREHELLDEMAAASSAVGRGALVAFLARLDDMERALDSYANPELMLDVLLLAWPRRASVV